MNKFANYRDGLINISNFRAPEAIQTDVQDILRAQQRNSGEILTAIIDSKEELRAVENAQ